MSRNVLFISLFCFLGSINVEASFFSTPQFGVIHCHSVWDDGDRTLEDWWDEAKENGWSFVFVTVHAGVVDNPMKLINNKEVDGPTGYANFVAECQRLSKEDGGIIRIIPSVELGTDSHSLILGVEKEKDFYKGLDLFNTQGQEAAVDYFYKKRYPVIAAHPDFYRVHPDPKNWRVNKQTSYYFDFDGVKKSHLAGATSLIYLNGIELLNYGDNQQAELSPLYHLGEYVFPTPMITGGCDFHTHKAEDGLWLWLKNQPASQTRFQFADRRLTVIWSRSNSVRDLTDNLKSAHCAACYTKKPDPDDLPKNYEPGIGWGITKKRPRVHEEYSLPLSVTGKYRWWSLKASLAKGVQLIPMPYEQISERVVLDADYDRSCYLQYWMLELETNSYHLFGSPSIMSDF